ncbi:hypothetical protein [Phenylobacterium montanum]|uniref:Uncharacterized protein n=1 Tax=Phenylobacterium montanum TaxID=2823693 RepID=A0A975G0I9_9CAUL|nr:hypothetical protein [Caulobacter sp. S6]QUD88312.1 hypothetical protein KCG34_25340 [Caulobacter sp. S6]
MAAKTTSSARSAGGAQPAVGIAPLAINRQRIPATVDFLGEDNPRIAAKLQPFRIAAANKVFLGLDAVKTSMAAITDLLNAPSVPSNILGVLNNADGLPAARVQITFDPAQVNAQPPATTVLTGDDGGFTIPMPSAAAMPKGGLTFAVHGANGNASFTLTPQQIAANGLVGVVALDAQLDPLPLSILGALKAILPQTLPDPGAPPPANPPVLPTVTLGEDDGCQMSFSANPSIDQFPYGVFIRLVEPRMSIVNEIIRIRFGDQGAFFPLTIYGTGLLEETVTDYVDRIPVDQPLSVDGFRDQIMGVGPDGITVADETVPMAASLGLGYVLEMQQQWTFKGVALGDLVYSLPLAPGEQQQVAVFERQDTSTVTESEFFTEEEIATQAALADTSTQATFNSAFEEAQQAGSSFQSSSSSWGAGGTLIIFSAGGGGTSSSGSSNEWLQGQRDTAQQAAQTTHSSSMSQAAARRSAARTGMRLASASESETVTTKVITNHNHTRAMTMQYWEVLRNYDVTTVIDGLTLACLVPMQIVRFLPPGQPMTITDPTTLVGGGGTLADNRRPLLTRYASMIKHLDVLQQAVPGAYRYGLTLLAQFAADPTAVVEPEGGVAEDVVGLTLTGSFLRCEQIWVSAVTRRNTRVGPVLLGNVAPAIPQDTFSSQDDLVAWLLNQRQGGSYTFTANLALPSSINRADIVGFEISRSFMPLSYTLISAEMAALNAINNSFGGALLGEAITSILGNDPAANVRKTIRLNPSDLESAVGGPFLTNFQAAIVEFDASGNPITKPPNETYANDSLGGVELPPQPYPVPALQISPVLRFHEILEIEKALHHVMRNTTLYSKALWSSMTPEERAILLDGYTIGVPSGGITDPSQMVPLMNCVQNRLLGFFGNSMILPFIIPPEVADSMQLDPAAIQKTLLAYHQANFDPPVSTASLPTRGVLGEAVLGHCPSSEKIDLTRFWNWQDAPADTAPAIAATALPTSSASLTTGLTAPNSLGALPSLINNVQAAPQPNMSLLQALGQNAASQKDFDTALTGAAQLVGLIQNAQNTGNQARADTLKTSQELTSQAITTLGNIVTSQGDSSKGGKSGGSGDSGSGGGSGGGGGSSGGSDAGSLASSLLPIILAAFL